MGCWLTYSSAAMFACARIRQTTNTVAAASVDASTTLPVPSIKPELAPHTISTRLIHVSISLSIGKALHRGAFIECCNDIQLYLGSAMGTDE